MFNRLCLILAFFGAHSAFAQDQDSLQPDSIYTKFKIQSRAGHYAGSDSKSKVIFLFDRLGRYSGFILTDNETGTIPQMKMIYTYNGKGFLISENDTSYRGNKFAVKTADFQYFPDGGVYKKSIKSNGKIISEIEYFPKENKQTEKLYRNETVYRVQTSYYDAHGKKTRFSGTEAGDKNAVPRLVEINGKKFTIPAQNKDEQWDYNFVNTYDDANRLVSKKRFVDGNLQDEEFYKYDDKGLLVEKIEKRGGNEQVIEFEYTYY